MKNNKYAKCEKCWKQGVELVKWVCFVCYKKKWYIKNKERLKEKTKAQYREKKENEQYVKDNRENAMFYYNANKDLINAKKILKRRLEKWLPCMDISVNNKIYKLPFESLVKPKFLNWQNNKEIEEYEKNFKLFTILRKYYEWI